MVVAGRCNPPDKTDSLREWGRGSLGVAARLGRFASIVVYVMLTSGIIPCSGQTTMVENQLKTEPHLRKCFIDCKYRRRGAGKG